MIFKTKPLITSEIISICLLCDGHMILVGSSNGTIKMWNINLIRNQTATIDNV